MKHTKEMKNYFFLGLMFFSFFNAKSQELKLGGFKLKDTYSGAPINELREYANAVEEAYRRNPYFNISFPNQSSRIYKITSATGEVIGKGDLGVVIFDRSNTSVTIILGAEDYFQYLPISQLAVLNEGGVMNSFTYLGKTNTSTRTIKLLTDTNGNKPLLLSVNGVSFTLFK